MTSPLVHDYPDWGRSLSSQDIKVMREQALTINALTNFGPFFVGNFPYLEIFFDCVGDRGRFRLNWFADAAMSENMGSDRFVVNDGGSLDFHVPTGGPWVQVRAEGNTYPVDVSPQVYMSHSPRTRMRNDVGFEPLLIATTLAAVAAAATTTVNATDTVPGEAHLSIDTDAMLWTARLQAVDLAGGVLNIVSTRNTYWRSPAQVYLPPQPCRISVTNNDAVARDFDVALLCHSLAGN